MLVSNTTNNRVFEKTSNDTIFEIFSYMTPSELCIAARVSKEFNTIANNKQLWRGIALKMEVTIDPQNADIKGQIKTFKERFWLDLSEVKKAITSFLNKSIETGLYGEFRCQFKVNNNAIIAIVISERYISPFSHPKNEEKKPKEKPSMNQVKICYQKGWEGRRLAEFYDGLSFDEINHYYLALKYPETESHIQEFVVSSLKNWKIHMDAKANKETNQKDSKTCIIQ